jgi:hypothetical protein
MLDSGILSTDNVEAPPWRTPTVTPEQKARQHIDQKLAQCGWLVQDYADMDITGRAASP